MLCHTLLVKALYVLLNRVCCRQAMLQCCRNFKEHFREARERALKALSFVKLLRKVGLMLPTSVDCSCRVNELGSVQCGSTMLFCNEFRILKSLPTT